MRISIIGSFRKYYDEIKKVIKLFEDNGIEILSPEFSIVTHSIDDFVVFASDNLQLSPADIQTETLNKILKSDVVFVYNPKGYVGRTTCYEIGVLRTTSISIFFLEKPKDLPINVDSNYIVQPKELVYLLKELAYKEYLLNSRQINIEKRRIKNEMRLKNIVICGSMMFYQKMVDIAEYLKRFGVSVVIPKEESREKLLLSEEEFNIFKRKVSNQYLSKIRDSSTYAILVLNEEKKEVPNYIGANTLVEISMAFCWGRSIYLLNDYYEPLIDELVAWNAICLNGDLDKMIATYKKDRYKLIDKTAMGSEFKEQINLEDL